MVKNGFYYDVYGLNHNAGVENTTWKQKNTTHIDHRIRKIFRFEKSTTEFKSAYEKWAKWILIPKDVEETKDGNV